jgi:hypothetical protein
MTPGAVLKNTLCLLYAIELNKIECCPLQACPALCNTLAQWGPFISYKENEVLRIWLNFSIVRQHDFIKNFQPFQIAVAGIVDIVYFMITRVSTSFLNQCFHNSIHRYITTKRRKTQTYRDYSFKLSVTPKQRNKS